MAPKFQAPPGTLDILPPGSVDNQEFDSARFAHVVGSFAEHMRLAGYGLIVGPLFEDLAVFDRVGETTDIVGKEMYDFVDKGDRKLALRPDSTPSVVRAFVEYKPTTPWKVWYLSPHFRYDKPQRWRYRQHHSVGVEVLGSDDPDVDVEVIALAADVIAAQGITNVELLVNSIGDPVCRPAYRDALLEFLAARAAHLCEEHRERFRLNPMRVLDCKKPPCRAATAEAPRFIDHLCEPCASHFTRVRAGLDAFGVKYTLQPRLVRGQDYYTRTTFEFECTATEASQNALGGGGRYDGLAEAMGGQPAPGIGFGLGVERLLLAADLEGGLDATTTAVDCFVVDLTGGEVARDTCRLLRRAGISADRGFDQRSLKAQMKAADRSGARLALIIGEDEAAAGAVTLRDLRERGEQERIDMENVVDVVCKRLADR